MTSKEYEQRLDELERQIAALRQEAVEEGAEKPPHPRPNPEKNQSYFYVDSTGEVNETNWAADQLDQKMYEFCNVFRAKEAAEFAIERLKVLGEIEEWSGEYGDPVSIAYYENDGKVEPIDALYPNRGEAVFANYEDADGCIRAIGQGRLKKYYFMIAEDEK